MVYLIAFIILATSFLDALRDTLYERTTWRKWHLIKWGSFYPPLAALLVLHIPAPWWVPTIIAAWALWQVGMRVGGKRWSSFWFWWWPK